MLKFNIAQQAEDKLNVRTILEQYLSENKKYEYEYLLLSIKQRQSSVQFMIDLLTQLKQCVNMLEPQLFESSLINSLIGEVKWQIHSNNSNVLNLFAEFLIDLTSAYTIYMYKCLQVLIKLFTVANVAQPPANGTTAPSTEPLNCEIIYSFTHQVILSFIKIAPSAKTHIVKLADQLSPYITKDRAIQEAYVFNLLRLATNIPDIRLNMLEICIQKMLKIDVNAPRDQIVSAEMESEEITEADIKDTKMKHAFADRLDLMMLRMFEYMKRECFEAADGQTLNWESCKRLYKDLLFIFDKYILSTYGSSHVQFLMFYVCSLRGPLHEGFLDYLWKKFCEPNTCQITRQICAYYIGSFLSRANYIHVNTLVASMQLMCTWLHNYLSKIDASKSYANIDLHRTFYSLCQTVFYVFIFRHHDLLAHANSAKHGDESANLMETIKAWKLPVIVSSKLNPLRFCLPTITKKFASLARLYQIAYCYSIIDANNRLSLPVMTNANIKSYAKNLTTCKYLNSSFQNLPTNETAIGKGISEGMAEANPLESFFPFDPYLLNLSKFYIERFYREYINEEDDQHANEEEDAEDEDDAASGDDDNSSEQMETHNPWSDDD